jgi:hypothetical protein
MSSLSTGLLSAEAPRSSDALPPPPPTAGQPRPAAPAPLAVFAPSRFQDPPLRRAPSIEGIERRAVSAGFLRTFTSRRVLADASLAKRCTKDGVKFLESTIKRLEGERDALRKSMQRSVVTGSMKASNKPSAGASEPASLLGGDAQLAQLGRRVDQFKFDLAERKGKTYMTTRDVHREVIKAEADAPRCRYVEQEAWIDAHDADGVPYVGVADFFVSHSWDSPWESVVDACVEHSDAQPHGATPTYYWIDIFAVNQHSPNGQHCTCDDNCIGCFDMMEDLPDWQLMQASHDVGFERVIRTTRKTLLVMEPWNAPRPPTRVWCLYESYITLQQPGGELIVALGREQRRSMQMMLQAKFSALEETIGRLDARNADVTVESDRTNIFGAIQQLDGGFDGLNKSLRHSLRVWLVSNAEELLERTDPERPRMTADELEAERKDHGACAMRITQLLDWWPGLHELLVLVAVTVVLFTMGYAFPAIDSERVDWGEEVVIYLLLLALLIMTIAQKLTEHQKKHQLRRVALFRGVGHMRRLKYASACMANYGFAALMVVLMWWFGMYGFTFGGGLFMLALCTLGMMTSNPQDVAIRHSMMGKTAWLYLQCDDAEKALHLFEQSAAVIESTLGVSDYFTVSSKVGKVQALHMCGREEEGRLLAAECLAQVDVALRCPRYTFEQSCLPTGGYAVNWMSRLAEPLGVIRRCDWLAVRASILAADGRPDAEVLSALDAAVSRGLMPSESSESESVVNTLGEAGAQRFVQSSFAFAAITERADAEAARTGTPSSLENLEERMHMNYKNRWRLKNFYRCVGFAGFVGLLVLMTVLMERADSLHLNGKQCTSIKGIYLGMSGCRVGRYCTTENECVSCPAAAGVASSGPLGLGECDAVDGEQGCCGAAFLRNCPTNPFNCSSG